jgi:hypothetical protein
MAVNDTYAFAVRGTVGTQTHVHTLHFRQLDPLGTEQMLIDQWQTSCEGPYKALFTFQDFPMEVIRAQVICGSEPLPAAVEETFAGAATEGTKTATTDSCPAFLAALVRERTALAGRTRQGRFFIGGLREADVSGNGITAEHIARLQAYCNALSGEFMGTSPQPFQLVVHSRKLAQPGVQCQVSSAPVTSLNVSSAATTMRSRKVGSGT